MCYQRCPCLVMPCFGVGQRLFTKASFGERLQHCMRLLLPGETDFLNRQPWEILKLHPGGLPLTVDNRAKRNHTSFCSISLFILYSFKCLQCWSETWHWFQVCLRLYLFQIVRRWETVEWSRGLNLGSKHNSERIWGMGRGIITFPLDLPSCKWFVAQGNTKWLTVYTCLKSALKNPVLWAHSVICQPSC